MLLRDADPAPASEMPTPIPPEIAPPTPIATESIFEFAVAVTSTAPRESTVDGSIDALVVLRISLKASAPPALAAPPPPAPPAPAIAAAPASDVIADAFSAVTLTS